MSLPNYEESGYGVNLDFANHLILVACFVDKDKLTSWNLTLSNY